MFSLLVLLFPLGMVWTVTWAISMFFGLVVLLFLFVAIIAWTIRVRARTLWTGWRTLRARCLWVWLFLQWFCCNFWSKFRSLCNAWWKKVALWSCSNDCVRGYHLFKRNLLSNRSRFLQNLFGGQILLFLIVNFRRNWDLFWRIFAYLLCLDLFWRQLGVRVRLQIFFARWLVLIWLFGFCSFIILCLVFDDLCCFRLRLCLVSNFYRGLCLLADSPWLPWFSWFWLSSWIYVFLLDSWCTLPRLGNSFLPCLFFWVWVTWLIITLSKLSLMEASFWKMLFDIKGLIWSIVRAHTISLWMLPQLSESVDILILAVIKEVLLVCSLQVLLEIRYLDDWLFEEFICLSFLHLSPSYLFSSSQLLSCWLRSLMSRCNWHNLELWLLLLRLFLCWLLIIKNLLLILFLILSFIWRKFCFLWLYIHHVHHTEEYYRCKWLYIPNFFW